MTLLTVFSVLSYIFIKQRQNENLLMVERIENVKNTVPPRLYESIRKLQGRLYSLEFENGARTQELLSLRRKLRDRLFAASGNGSIADESRYLSLPSIYNYLPHLLGHEDALTPLLYHPSATRHGANEELRRSVSLTFGIPTVKRNKESYLVKTLRSLVDGLSLDERHDVLIIVYVGERNSDYVHEIYASIKRDFTRELEDGLIEVISPPVNYYPDLDNLPQTFGDPKERVKWRSKQNLDYAFLMMYAQARSAFYVQLEDDVIATPSYAGTIKAFAVQQKTNSWFMIEFSSLGFIGKLFRASDLSTLVEFFLMFYKEKPNDWLLDHIFWVKACHPEKSAKHCRLEKAKLRIKFKPSLFQHVGKESSLKGKKQTLVDKEFKKQPLFKAHVNPRATIKTDLEEYQKFTAERGYLGHSYFWALTPLKNAVLRIVFARPERLETFLFKTGNVEHPADKLVNGTVEVIPHDTAKRYAARGVIEKHKHTRGVYLDTDYVSVGSFDRTGEASGKFPELLQPVSELRIRVTEDVFKNWVLFSEFFIVQQKNQK